jgi:hypothetical protein
MNILQSCTQKGVVILLQTDSINQVESVDGRYGSWQGGLQRNMDRVFPVTSIKAMLDGLPVPQVAGLEDFVLRPLSFESHLSRTTWDVANVYGMAPTGRNGTAAYTHGRGLQATSQSAGQARTQTSVATAMECYVATQKVGDSYTVTVDGVEIAKVTSTSNVRKWRKHERIGMPLGQHSMVITFTSGTCLFDAIDHHVGSERKGIRIVNAGRSGVSLNSYAKTGPASDSEQKWAEVHPLLADDQVSGVDIGILTLSTNNMGDPEDAFEQMLDEYVSRFQSVNKNGLLHIMFPAQPNAIPANGDDWPGKHRAAHRVAAKYEWVSVDSLWAGEVPGRIPRIENTESDKIKGLHPKSKVLLGDNLPYGYAKLSAAILDQSAFTGVAPDPGEEVPDPGGDVTPPTVAVITGDNLTVNENGSFTFSADITDASPVGIAAVRTVAGDLLGNLINTTGSRYELTLTWRQLRAFLADGVTAVRWFIVAYDTPGNRTATSARNLTVVTPSSAPVAPVIANITATGFSTAGASITISADVSHDSGIEIVPLNIEGAYAVNLVRPASGISWTGTFDRNLFQGGDDYAVGARSKAGTTAFSARLPYTLVGTADVTAPTGRMTKPITNTTLPDAFTLEAYVVDADSGVARVSFFVESTFLVDGDYTSQGLFSVDVTAQAVITASPTGRRLRARMEDRAGNVSYTDWIDFSVPEQTITSDAFVPVLDGNTRLPGEPAVLAAWDARFGGAGGATGLSYATDPDGVPVLVVSTDGTYLQDDPDGTPVLVLGS